MANKQGTLVLVLTGYRSESALHSSNYFVIKVGKNCVRFNRLSGELVFHLENSDPDMAIEMFMFQRRVRKGNEPIGRRRDLIDKTSSYIFRSPYTNRSQTRTEWNSFEIKFANRQMYFLFDIEFYQVVPLLPPKTNEDANKKNLAVRSIDQKKKKTPFASDVMPQNITKNTKKLSSEQKTTRKRDAFKISAISNLIKESKKEESDSTEKFSSIQKNHNTFSKDTIFYDLEKLKNGQKIFHGYQHGSTFTQQDALSCVDSQELYTFIKTSQHKPAIDERLKLDISPQIFFQSVENRMNHNQNLNFTNMFSSDNVKLTGYLGSGKWDKKIRSDAFMNWYLRGDVCPIIAPRLPPKCPIGMLWEEYYITNKEPYIHDVLR